MHQCPGYTRKVLYTCLALAGLVCLLYAYEAPMMNGETAWAASTPDASSVSPPFLTVNGTVPSTKFVGDLKTSLTSKPSTPAVTSTPVEVSPAGPHMTQQSCNAKVGRFETMSMRATYLPLPMDVLVYLPPCYDKQVTARFPVLYLIHGQGFREDQWDRLGADETAEMLFRTQQVPQFIIVMPHDSFLRDPRESPFGRAFIEILIPWVDKTYRTLDDREHRAIGGLSRGGAWAFYLGLSHHDMFSAIGMHSSFFFNGLEFPTRTMIQSIPPEEMPRLFIDIGGEDHLLQANRQLEKLLMKENVAYEWYLFPGRHEESYWSSHMEQYLLWYTRDW